MKYYKYELDVKKMNVLVLIGFIPFIILMLYKSIFFAPAFDNFYITFTGLIVVFALHELCHGLGYALFAKDKKKIKYGVALEKGVLYAMCQDEINKTGIIVSLLMPLIFLTLILGIVGIIISSPLLIFLAIINLLGAVGDIMMIVLAIKLPKSIKYIDYNADIGAYFLCEEDISQIKTIGIKCVESGPHTLDKVDNRIKRFTFSRGSIPYVFFFLVVITFDLMLDLILKLIN